MKNLFLLVTLGFFAVSCQMEEEKKTTRETKETETRTTGEQQTPPQR